MIRLAIACLALWVFCMGACGGTLELVSTPSRVASVILLRNVAVLDVTSGERRTGLDVWVRDGRIARITATGKPPPSTVAAGVRTEVIEGRGGTLLPGLIDLHAHTGTSAAPPGWALRPDPAANLRAYLYCGVTTVIDLGDLGTDAMERRRATATGRQLGPTLYASGPVLTAPGGHPVPVLRLLLPGWMRWYAVPRFALQVANPAEAAAAVERLADDGADFVKVVVDRIPPEAPRLSNASLRAAVETASHRGLRTVAHIGTTGEALEAARAGVAAWAHGVYRERIPDERIAELASFDIPMVPTIVVFEALAQRGEPGRKATALERETVPAEVLAAFGRPLADDEASRFFARSARALAQQRGHWRENVRRLHAAGVTILAGSDMQSGVFPGAGLHRELHHLRESGLSNLEAIRAATLDAARFLENRDDPSFGIVAEGKRADLLLVDGDPRESLDFLERIRAVLVRGVRVERRALGR